MLSCLKLLLIVSQIYTQGRTRLKFPTLQISWQPHCHDNCRMVRQCKPQKTRLHWTRAILNWKNHTHRNDVTPLWCVPMSNDLWLNERTASCPWIPKHCEHIYQGWRIQCVQAAEWSLHLLDATRHMRPSSCLSYSRCDEMGKHAWQNADATQCPHYSMKCAWLNVLCERIFRLHLWMNLFCARACDFPWPAQNASDPGQIYPDKWKNSWSYYYHCNLFK